ncbi:Rho GTPase activation protein [Zopfochytrium polystomum]|nr:Rho GTPase activation protein [Zopfochytrium polystomum]
MGRNLSVGGLRGAQSGVNKMVSNALNWGRKRNDPVRPTAITQSRAAFGLPLDQAVALTRISETLELPAIVYRCIDYLLVMKGVEEEGIYRLSGSSNTIQMLREKFNTEGDVDLVAGEPYDVHAVAGVLKLYLREIPVPILTQHLLRDFNAIIDLEDRNDRIRELATLMGKLPSPNYTLLRVLCSHLVEVVQRSEVNKMTVRNVGIVFSPTLGIPAPLFGLMLGEFDVVFATPHSGASISNGEGPSSL